jgi:hypothetical protein
MLWGGQLRECPPSEQRGGLASGESSASVSATAAFVRMHVRS